MNLFCNRYRRDLDALVDGELAPPRADRVRAHLERCAECRRAYAATAKLAAFLDRLPTPQPDPSLIDAVMSRLPAGLYPRPAAPVVAFERPRSIFVLVPLAALSLLVLLLLCVAAGLIPGLEDLLRLFTLSCKSLGWAIIGVAQWGGRLVLTVQHLLECGTRIVAPKLVRIDSILAPIGPLLLVLGPLVYLSILVLGRRALPAQKLSGGWRRKKQ